MAKTISKNSRSKVVMLKNGRTRTYTKNSSGKYKYSGGAPPVKRKK